MTATTPTSLRDAFSRKTLAAYALVIALAVPVGGFLHQHHTLSLLPDCTKVQTPLPDMSIEVTPGTPGHPIITHGPVYEISALHGCQPVRMDR